MALCFVFIRQLFQFSHFFFFGFPTFLTWALLRRLESVEMRIWCIKIGTEIPQILWEIGHGAHLWHVNWLWISFWQNTKGIVSPEVNHGKFKYMIMFFTADWEGLSREQNLGYLVRPISSSTVGHGATNQLKWKPYLSPSERKFVTKFQDKICLL
jgi:hypothetical protein